MLDDAGDHRDAELVGQRDEPRALSGRAVEERGQARRRLQGRQRGQIGPPDHGGVPLDHLFQPRPYGVVEGLPGRHTGVVQGVRDGLVVVGADVVVAVRQAGGHPDRPVMGEGAALDPVHRQAGVEADEGEPVRRVLLFGEQDDRLGREGVLAVLAQLGVGRLA